MKRYIILIAAATLQLCLGGVYAWSTFVPELEAEFGINQAHSQHIFGTCIFVFTLTMILAGWLQNRYGPRWIALIGAVCYGAAYLGAGFFGRDYWSLIIFKGVLEGVGIGFGYVCPLATVLKWFPRKKGLAAGVVVGGFGAGGMILSSIAFQLLNWGFSVSEIFLYFGVGYLLLASISAMLLTVPPLPEYSAESVKSGKRTEATSLSLYKLLLDSRFLVLSMGMFCGTFTGLLIIGSLKPMGLEAGLPETLAVLAISLFSVGNSAGRIIWGALADRFGKVMIPLSLLFLSGVVAWVMPLRDVHSFIFVVMAGLVGFGFGACFVLYAAETARYFSSEAVGTVYPLIFFLGYGLPGIFGPVAGGWLRESTGNYHFPIVLAATVPLFGALITGVLFREPNKGR